MRRLTNGLTETIQQGGMQPQREGVVRTAYNDVLNDLPYHPDYDRWEPFDQLNYERARLYARNILTAGLPFPSWPLGVPHPDVFWRLLAFSIHKSGDPIPLAKEHIMAIVAGNLRDEIKLAVPAN